MWAGVRSIFREKIFNESWICMRFFTPSIPAGRLEYLGVLIVTTLMSMLVVFTMLELRVDQLTGQIAYSADRLAVGLLFYMIIWVVSFVNVLRRLTDLGMSGWWALALIVPLVGLVFQLYLLVASGINTRTYAPYGEDPLNPDSWVPSPSQSGPTGPSVTYNGQALYLPGEDVWDSDAA